MIKEEERERERKQKGKQEKKGIEKEKCEDISDRSELDGERGKEREMEEKRE